MKQDLFPTGQRIAEKGIHKIEKKARRSRFRLVRDALKEIKVFEILPLDMPRTQD
jgi:hypothetical protein